MTNILIDTCSWINLLSEESNKLLPHLEYWKKNNCIKIISHEKIIEEWNFHKEKHKNRLSESLKTKYRHTKVIAKKERLRIPEELSPNLDEIENQIKLIDDLLVDSTVLKTPNEIKVYCADRHITKEAPFHNKADSMKDAYIIFTALKHFSELNEEIIFISDNKKDFGSPKHPETEIHPQITESYSKIKLRYFKDIGRAINTLEQELPTSLLPEDINVTKSSNFEDEIIIDKTKPVLDQVYDYVSIRHKEIKFYPISLFINHYPLKLSLNNYYSIFDLKTDNEDLFDLFKSVEISQDNKIRITDEKFCAGVKDHDDKIRTVLLRLSTNLIFNISSYKSKEQLSIRYSNEEKCECPKCSFNRFKFSECFKSLNTYTNSKEDLQESSYLNYQIGNFLFAVDKQQKALNKYKKEHQNTSYFISKFNLSKLLVFIRNNYIGEHSQHDLVNELKVIDLEYEETNLRPSNENSKLIKHIKDNSFYTDARNNIQATSSKIIDQYYSSLGGGWSSNSDVWILINEFAKLESFLVGNQIFYDKFKEFQDVFSIFLEGIFASHAITNPHHSRLDRFDDWLFTITLQYGNTEIINKYFKRYKLKKIRYRKTSSNGNSFHELINNFFNNENLRELFIENCESNNRWFWDYYNRIFKNILTLVSITDLEKTFINEFSEQLVKYLEIETYIHPQSYKQLNTFLYSCGESLETNIIYRFFNLGINNRFYHNTYFYDALLEVTEQRKLKINIDNDQFEKIKSIAFEVCPLCKEKHQTTVIFPLYLMIKNDDYKGDIKDLIQLKLKEKFSFDLFYQSTLFELIPLDKDMLDKAIEVSFPKREQESIKSFITGIDDNRFTRFDSLLNLCFMFNIDTTTEQFEPFRSLDPYYEWLIDMDNFDYNHFEAEWIGEYPTRYYYRKIYNNRYVKEKMDSIIKDKFEPNIERDYINIFIRKTWDVKDKQKP